MSNVKVKCPKCGTYAEGRTNLFKSTITCLNCGEKINPKKDSSMLVTCHSCGQSVLFDTRFPEKQECPVCHASLASYMIMDVEIECPKCHLHEMVKNNETNHTCPICGVTIDVQKAKAKKEAPTGTASLITVPYDNKNVIWVHPQTSFPYASQVIVPEGYTALILRNGRCSAPSKPGNYLLSDSLKALGDQLQDAVFDQNTQVSVQVIFVKNTIDSDFTWTGRKVKVPDDEGGVAGTLGFGGMIRLKVVDSRRLAEFAEYKNASVQDLIAIDQPLFNKVCGECFNAGYMVFRSAVLNKGLSYKSLTMDLPLFETEIKRDVNERLAEIGLQTSDFKLEFVDFDPSESATIADRIGVYIEKPFDWESDKKRIRMDDSIFADVRYGGTVKFRLANKNIFLDRSEVKEWISHGIREDAVKEYFSGLAAIAANDVLTTQVQKLISEKKADIRDLTELYIHIKGTVLNLMNQFFGGYGLAVDQFYFTEKERTNSQSLDKLIESQKHKTDKTIDLDTHKFDNEIDVQTYRSDTQKTLTIDDINVGAQTHITQNNEQRTNNVIEGLKQADSVSVAKEMLGRSREILHKGWKKEDAKSEHEETMQKYAYSGEEESALHYLNQQLIRNQAEELRTRWEEQSRLDYDQLKHSIGMNDLRDDAYDNRAIKARDLAYRFNIGDAENERAVNSILRKIAESDLELTEKIDEYSRILSNKLEDDKLRQFVDRAKAENGLFYDKNHIKNILSEEELKILEDARQRASDRVEKIKDSDFARSLKEKELTIWAQMECLRMEYEKEKRESESNLELHDKQLEIDKLKMMLDHYEKLDDNDVERLGIREINNTIRTRAESQFRAEHEKAEREAAEKREQDRLDREERYGKRADDLLTKVLSIQEALKKLSLENEKVYIQENAGVEKARAEAEIAKISNADMEKLIKELKEMANAMMTKKASSGTSRPSHPAGPAATPVTFGGSTAGQQPGTRKCPHCGTVLPAYAITTCPTCLRSLL